MWLSWELLALGTWANKLLLKGQLPSLYRLLFFPLYAPYILLAFTFLDSLYTTVCPLWVTQTYPVFCSFFNHCAASLRLDACFLIVYLVYLVIVRYRVQHLNE